jgi:CheY-like chemotaxis protein
MDLARLESKDPKITEYFEKMLATMKRAKALTLQLLTFSKGGAPVQKITPLTPFIQESAQFALSGSNISCRFSLADDLHQCNIDKDQIAQVIDNIVINAQQAMPDGGTIEISAVNLSFKEKEHPSLSKGDYVKVSIKDTGVGIPREILPRIFDPFYTTKLKGHGLGLAMCYSIINRHGGCIDVESQPGKGSTFHVYLPASSEAAAAKAATVNTHKGSGTIIVMDDEAVLRDTIRQMLELMGYTVICKGNGKEAVDFFMSETPKRFAAMIFDLTVPGGMGGLEAVTEIRKSDKEIPIFVSSGYAENSVMKNPVEYGFTASIAKPFTLGDLSEMLNNHLAK